MRVEIIDYNKTIRGRQILKDINLVMESGKVYGLRGTNGSGKTMLMRAISGLILPTSGNVLIDGKEINKDISFPESMGLFLEYSAFVKGYTGIENLKMIASIKKKADVQRIRECIKLVGLDPDDKRTFRKYSLGMKQKLGIACAIMENPDLLILDEPFNALDEKGIEVVKKIIKDFKANNALVIVSCHDKEELNNISDEIYEMYEGEIVR